MASYDKAYELARELRSCQEYKEYQKAKGAILANESAMGILRDYQEKKMVFEMALLGGKAPDEAEREEMAKLTEIVSMHGEVGRFLEAEARILTVISDVQKILVDAMNLLDYR